MRKRTMKIRPDLRATLKEGSEVVIVRAAAPGSESRIMLKSDEWQELADWVRTEHLLAGESPGCI